MSHDTSSVICHISFLGSWFLAPNHCQRSVMHSPHPCHTMVNYVICLWSSVMFMGGCNLPMRCTELLYIPLWTAGGVWCSPVGVVDSHQHSCIQDGREKQLGFSQGRCVLVFVLVLCCAQASEVYIQTPKYYFFSINSCFSIILLSIILRSIPLSS
jgi:hypothetical protein